MTNRIKKLRGLWGLTQRQLAEKIGTTQQTIARWEAGKTDLTVTHIKELAVLFEVPVDEILGIDTPSTAWKDDTFAIADAEMPWGTLKLVFSFREFEYPIDENAWRSLDIQLSARRPGGGDGNESDFLYFWTLDNKLGFANYKHILEVALISDDAEAMPEFLHPEVYAALQDWETSDPSKIGSVIRQKCEEVISEVGEDKLYDLFHSTHIVAKDGREFWRFMLEEDEAFDIWVAEISHDTLKDDCLIKVKSEGRYVQHYINLRNVAVIEVPSNLHWRLNAPERRAEKID